MSTVLDHPELDVLNQIKEIERKLSDKSKEVMPAFTKAKSIPVTIRGDSDGFTATSPALPGCIGEGDTLEEALGDFETAFTALIETYAAEGMQIPWKQVDSLPLNESVRIFSVAFNG